MEYTFVPCDIPYGDTIKWFVKWNKMGENIMGWTRLTIQTKEERRMK